MAPFFYLLRKAMIYLRNFMQIRKLARRKSYVCIDFRFGPIAQLVIPSPRD